MTLPPIPSEIVYAGLLGTVLSLIVATATNNWSMKVFFLLALRLAIGWQFLFEGLNKVNSYYTGPNETTKRFSSEPYFKVGPGPIAPYMRKQFDDPEATITSSTFPARQITPDAFRKLTGEEQAAACPPAVASELDAVEAKGEEAIKKRAEASIKAAEAAAAKAEKDAKTPEDKVKLLAMAAADKKEAEQRLASPAEFSKPFLIAAKATYARWVYGVDGRPAKFKSFSGDLTPSLSAPIRLQLIVEMKRQLAAAEEMQSMGLGNGTGVENKRVADLRTELINADSDLAKEARAFIAELKFELTGEKVEETKEESQGAVMDRVTMWFLVVSGGCLLAGLFTRVACVSAAGFLIMTYLTHPPFPWYVAPPGTEGNPLFVNKNAIECLALLALACMPTGRWMGLDALVLWPFLKYDREKI